MKLDKFNLPRIVVDAISCAAPEVQGLVYASLFSFIYNGDSAPGEMLSGEAKAIYTLAKALVEPLVARAYRAAERRAAKNDKTEDMQPVIIADDRGASLCTNESTNITEILSPDQQPKSNPQLPAPKKPKIMLIPPGARRKRAETLYKKRRRA